MSSTVIAAITMYYPAPTFAPVQPYLISGRSLAFAGNVTGPVYIENFNKTRMEYGWAGNPFPAIEGDIGKVIKKHLVFEGNASGWLDIQVDNFTEVGYLMRVDYYSSNAGSSRPNKKLYWLGLLLAASTAFLG